MDNSIEDGFLIAGGLLVSVFIIIIMFKFRLSISREEYLLLTLLLVAFVALAYRKTTETKLIIFESTLNNSLIKIELQKFATENSLKLIKVQHDCILLKEEPEYVLYSPIYTKYTVILLRENVIKYTVLAKTWRGNFPVLFSHLKLRRYFRRRKLIVG